MKHICMLQGIWLDQADAQQIKEGEEVTLMDWGNCFLMVRCVPVVVFLCYTSFVLHSSSLGTWCFGRCCFGCMCVLISSTLLINPSLYYPSPYYLSVCIMSAYLMHHNPGGWAPVPPAPASVAHSKRRSAAG